ncbi:MAG: hypothetical protein H8K05_20710, partial [Nitrospira sp.]|nr:hypothetical protein [Nitrospira sp.]
MRQYYAAHGKNVNEIMSEAPHDPMNPNASGNAQAKTGGTAKGTSEAAVPDFIDVHRGKELTETSAIALAYSKPVQWVVIAGPVGSGKTTLLTSLYELFQWGCVENHLFAESLTLPALEERCHLSRMISDIPEPDTARTPYDPPTYLHLKVCSSTTKRSCKDLLFTDVSGEMFEYASNSTEACKELKFLRRASHFVMLLDSEKALRFEKRWVMVEGARTLLRSCFDSGMLRRDCVIHIVWSKFDYFVEAGDKQEHKEFRDEVMTRFQSDFESRTRHLQFREVASRPTKAPNLGFAKGVGILLNQWVTVCPRVRSMKLSAGFSGSRESELFG